MTATAVNVKRVQRMWDNLEQPVDAVPDLEADLAKARWLANLWDAQFSLGGIKFGLDAIVGLVPGVGDLAGFLAGLYPLYLAQRHGLGKVLQARMFANLLADFAIGSVPVVGDVIDVGFKAHLKNVALLERAVVKRRDRAE
jgi:hypothetical protein